MPLQATTDAYGNTVILGADGTSFILDSYENNASPPKQYGEYHSTIGAPISWTISTDRQGLNQWVVEERKIIAEFGSLITAMLNRDYDRAHIDPISRIYKHLLDMVYSKLLTPGVETTEPIKQWLMNVEVLLIVGYYFMMLTFEESVDAYEIIVIDAGSVEAVNTIDRRVSAMHRIAHEEVKNAVNIAMLIMGKKSPYRALWHTMEHTGVWIGSPKNQNWT